MKTKLTLSIEQDIVQQAHRQASKEKRSVSSMFSDFLMERQSRENTKKTSVNDMVGTLKGYNIDDTKSAIRRITAKKHLAKP